MVTENEFPYNEQRFKMIESLYLMLKFRRAKSVQSPYGNNREFVIQG